MNTRRLPLLVVGCCTIFALIAAVSQGEEPTGPELPPIFPKALAPGDTIMFVAPAKYLDKDRVMLAKKRLEAMGFKVRIPKDLFRKKGFLGGSDEERAGELMAAFKDPAVDAIFPGTGGYGTTRIVDKLDYDVIRRHPKILVGFSDITGLHIAINQRTGLVTFHSPVPEWGLGSEENLSPFAAKWFWRAILAKSYSKGSVREVSLSPRAGYTILPTLAGSGVCVGKKPADKPPPPVTIRGGVARGRLIGGNLSVVNALMGTPYEIQTDGKILFLEDVGEDPYRIDRMLNTLRLAGKFDHAAGILLGQFTTRKDQKKWDDDESMDDVLNDYFAKLRVPVLAHFPFGHVRYNATLPEGAMAELDAKAQTLRILENPVAP
ncbi:MAG TPA: LD-carboxypeptidase [Lacipirellulaceae bacterium]|nr:LD-carboxypeptidase [Lacipirellulaceae bacterium]